MSVNKTVENVYLRHDAVELTRKHFWRLLGMMLVIGLLSVGLEHLLVWLGKLLNAPIDSATAETLIAASPTASNSALVFVVNLIFTFVSSLFASGLSLGHNAQLINAGRGGVPKVFGVFKRMRYCLKGWCLELLIGLKALLWMLPGLVLVITGAELQSYGESAIANWVVLAGLVLMLSLFIPAILRYSLAHYLMADEPDRGIRECITLSKELMKGRKWQYFKLGVPMLLKMIGVFYAASLVFSLVIVAIGSSASLAAQIIVLIAMLLVIAAPCIYFGLQMDMAYVLFYLKRREPAADAPVSYWLKDHSTDDPAQAAPVSNWLREHTATDIASADNEAADSPEAPEESAEDSPVDISPETNEEKEKDHE